MLSADIKLMESHLNYIELIKSQFIARLESDVEIIKEREGNQEDLCNGILYGMKVGVKQIEDIEKFFKSTKETMEKYNKLEEIKND